MNEWKTYILSEICDLVAGYAFKSGDFGDYPHKVVKIGDITPPYVEYQTMLGVDLSKYDSQKLKKYEIGYDDFILAMTGATIGKIGRYIADKPAYINQRVLLFKPKESVCAKYVYFLLSSDQFKKYVINHIDSESAQPNISAGTIGKYSITLPPLPDQKRIAAILSSLDDKIENNRRINKNLEEQAQALFKSWFVDFEPFKDGKFVDSELGMIPKGWRVYGFSEFLTASTEKVGREGVPEYSVTNTGIHPREEKFLKNLSKTSAKNKILRKGNLVFGMSRDILNWGIMKDSEGGVSSAYNIFLVDEGKVDVVFLENFISHKMDYFRDLIKPATREGQGLDKTALMAKNIYMPTATVLSDFMDKYLVLNRRIEIYKQENLRLAQLRDTLLPKLMNGEIELSD